MNWLKAAVVGLVGSLAMFILIQLGINVGMAPFNKPPSAAFLISVKDNLGIPPIPWALVIHFGYGLVWSVVLVAVARRGANVWKGFGLGVFLWLIMMLVFTPIIGWGLFGLGGSPEGMAEDAPLYLEPGPKYIIATLILHLVYGGLVGWLDGLWIGKSDAAGRGAASQAPSSGRTGGSEPDSQPEASESATTSAGGQ